MGFAALSVNCQKIKDNINEIKHALKGPSKVLLIAKADAYGLGAQTICSELHNEIDYIGVA